MGPRKIAKILGAVGITAVIAMVVIAVVVVRHRSREQLLRRAIDVMPGSLLHARNFHWTQMKGDARQWELKASEASYSDDKTSLKLSGTELSMMLEDGKLVKLKAPKAQLQLNGNHVDRAELSGGLELNYGTVILTTADATFFPDQDQLQAAGPVKIQGEGFNVSGVGLEASPHKRLFSLKHQVSTQLIPGTERVAATNS